MDIQENNLISNFTDTLLQEKILVIGQPSNIGLTDYLFKFSMDYAFWNDESILHIVDTKYQLASFLTIEATLNQYDKTYTIDNSGFIDGIITIDFGVLKYIITCNIDVIPKDFKYSLFIFDTLDYSKWIPQDNEIKVLITTKNVPDSIWYQDLEMAKLKIDPKNITTEGVEEIINLKNGFSTNRPKFNTI